MSKFVWFALMLFASTASAQGLGEGQNSLMDSIDLYESRYGLRDVFAKRVDNHGNGFESLYGLRNMRVVLNGVVFRGGANNAYHRSNRRANSNPLTPDGLENLCEEGFDTSVYLYPTNYHSAAKTTSCRTRFNESHTLNYQQHSVLASDSAVQSILQLVYRKLNGETQSNPIYLHCWNGWHASGFISAILLRQFCALSAEDAVDYWNRNTDGSSDGSSGYDKIRARIRAYRPSSTLQISGELQRKICL